MLSLSQPPRPRFAELLKFLVVGGGATVITVSTFNLLTHIGPAPLLNDRPITAYSIGMVLGIIFSYVGNRLWAFNGAAANRWVREFLMFAAANGLSLLIPSICLAFSRYVLGLSSALADNVAANGVGLVLATLFRYVVYRGVIFRPGASH